MNAKIIAGIIIGMVIVIGLGYSFSNSGNNSDQEIIVDNNIIIEPIETNDGTQFTIELSDSVQATGP